MSKDSNSLKNENDFHYLERYNQCVSPYEKYYYIINYEQDEASAVPVKLLDKVGYVKYHPDSQKHTLPALRTSYFICGKHKCREQIESSNNSYWVSLTEIKKKSINELNCKSINKLKAVLCCKFCNKFLLDFNF